MPDITLKNRVIYDANIGAVICNTPKTLNDEYIDGALVDRRCMLIDNADDFIKYFGDPYINPAEYTDAMMALSLVNRNVRMYVSSVYEMQDNDDGFDIPYNGYTEFYFLDKNKYETVGYKLKSDIKFCQPIIQCDLDVNKLTIYVPLFLLDKTTTITESTKNTFDTTSLYTVVTVDFDTNTAKDVDIVNALKEYGLDLKIINTSGESDFIDQLKSIKRLRVVSDQRKFIDEHGRTELDYRYDLHQDGYVYNFSDIDHVVDCYLDAITRLRNAPIEPQYVCLSKLYRSTVVINDGDDKFIARQSLGDLDPFNYAAIHSLLLNVFDPDGKSIVSNGTTLNKADEESNTYLFISVPDIQASSAYKWLSCTDEYSNMVTVEDQYNCDLYYGFVSELVQSSTYYPHFYNALIPASTLSMYNLLLNGPAYMNNSVGGLNLASNSVKTIISESTAKKFSDNRCNSVVTFDIGVPSIYGNRSLSTLPRLRYSHISRNYVFIRRLIKNYLETKKFELNTVFSADICINYIRVKILDQFKMEGILSNYDIDYTLSDRTVNIRISLYFVQMLGSFNLNFTI